MKILVTCGPSYEPIDEVRRIVNFSTGALGTKWANYLTEQGHEVTCFTGIHATTQQVNQSARKFVFSTTHDLAQQLEKISKIESFNAVFHAAALADFEVAEVSDGKGHLLKSAKIDSKVGECFLKLKSTQKVIGRLRNWFPHALIVGWKYELEGDRSSAIEKAQAQIHKNGTDACVLNGRAYGIGYGICLSNGEMLTCQDQRQLYSRLLQWLNLQPQKPTG